MKNIVLIGIMGCGKTTVSKLLAQKMQWPVIDMDEYLMDKHQCTINDMFALSEEHFRDLESQACVDLSKLEGHIISTGGGVVKRKQNCDILRENGIVIYLDRPVKNIVCDVTTTDRPLLKDGPQKLYDLYHERHQLYLDACDYHVYNDGTLDEVISQIESIIEKQDEYNA